MVMTLIQHSAVNIKLMSDSVFIFFELFLPVPSHLGNFVKVRCPRSHFRNAAITHE